MRKMSLYYIAGINGDRIKVKILNNEENIFTNEYSFGYDASYNRRYAKYAEEDHEKAIKYNWSRNYPLKPYIGDIINDLAKEYNIDKNNIEYSGGIYIFSQRNMTEEETQKVFIDLFKEM